MGVDQEQKKVGGRESIGWRTGMVTKSLKV